MTQFIVVQKGSAQYLVYDLQGSNRTIDDITVMMINNNQKKNGSIAKISFDELNGEKQRILFEITDMRTLSEYLRCSQISESCRSLLLSIVSAIDGFAEYMIDADSVLLNPDFVFINTITRQVMFICPPFQDKSDLPTADLSTFFRSICTIAFTNPTLRPSDSAVLQAVVNAAADPVSFSPKAIRKILSPEQMPDPAAQPVPADAAAPAPVAGVSGDVAFEPSAALSAPVPMPAAGKNDKSGKKAKAAKPAKPAKAPADANIPAVPMPDADGKDDKGLFGKFKKKFKKNEGEGAANPSGGLADLANGKQQGKPAPMPAQPPMGGAPAPMNMGGAPAPMNMGGAPAPMNMGGAPVPMNMGGTPAPMPASSQIPNSAQSAPNHTILIPSGSQAQPLSSQGIAAMSARMDQAQQNLYSSPAPSAFPQTPAYNHVMDGGMSGLPAVGLPPVQNPAPVSAPPVPEQDDDQKTVVMFPDDDKTVLMRKSYLVRKKDGTKTVLEKPLIRIGRNRPDLEINLRGNNHIGHIHASILMSNGSYAVIDHQSVNHTYLNHQQLEPEKQYPLKNGDLIVFADEEFEFQSED